MIRSLFSISIMLLCLSSCEKNIDTRGTYIPGDNLKKLEIGVDKYEDVLQKCGSPYMMITKDEWVYLSKKEVRVPLRKDSIIKEKNVRIKFNQKGVLENVDSIHLKKANISTDSSSTDVNKKL